METLEADKIRLLEFLVTNDELEPHTEEEESNRLEHLIESTNAIPPSKELSGTMSACPQIDLTALASSLGHQIAAFCSDSVVLDFGDWHIQVLLNPKRFGKTRLDLSFSYFRVQLIFDAPEPQIKEVLLNHSDTLQRELSQTLNRFGETRNVAIFIS